MRSLVWLVLVAAHDAYITFRVPLNIQRFKKAEAEAKNVYAAYD